MCMCQSTKPLPIQIVASHMFATKVLFEHTLGYCQPIKQNCIEIWIKIWKIHSSRWISNYRLQNGGHSVSASMVPTCQPMSDHRDNLDDFN